ncbi:type III PLP-dependent enzyme [Rhizobium sp. MHM7A]|uniref:type III PLP-dependent enzyme n=1 Tax=Rhizobium sp. MHM7A TaxID=2583233 RepID=UPI001106CB80|nr:type III PLP-dependent enzyme [Rhizobium sp. MHM7A]TLX16411.1 type III PLP-dependent enzyme [Rhizobium sp. MHM7A]
MSDRIYDFFRSANPASPCLVVDLDIIRENYQRFTSAMPDMKVYYAIKANPEHKILSVLASEGSNFDCASVAEIEMALSAGEDAKRISFGNTIKKASDIARAFDVGVRLFATDSMADMVNIARHAPGSDVFCRILTTGEGAEWPLSRKFGCDWQMAVDILCEAYAIGLNPRGVSFHVGSQMTVTSGWRSALEEARLVFDACAKEGVHLDLVNLGGGFPIRYLKDIPTTEAYGAAILADVDAVFPEKRPALIIEPGRGMVGNAGIIKSEVVMASFKSASDHLRWVFLDIGKFGGLAETMDEAIRYPIRTSRDGEGAILSVLAGPTCDSADVLYEKTPYALPPVDSGDFVFIEGTGAYTTTYSAVAFNGFQPLKSYVI